MKYIFLLIMVLAISGSTQAKRPTLEYLVIFDDNQQVIVEGDSLDEALERFKKENSYQQIYSVARRSFVESIWIWK